MEADIYRATAYLDKELETLLQWSNVAPQDPRPWYKRFYIYMDMGWRKEAEEASARVLKLAPNNARSHITRAILYYRSNEPALGLPPIEQAERLAPENSEPVSLHATILMKNGQAAEAEALLRKLVERAPQEPQFRLALAQALARNGNREEAEALLRALQTEQPDSVEVAYESGLLAEKRGDLSEAARQFQKAVALDASHGNVLFCLGRVAIKQGRTEEGKALQKRFKVMDGHAHEFETALNGIRTRPNDPALHRQLAQAYLANNELPQAILELRRVLELRPNDAQTRRDLAAALNQHGRITEARRLAGNTHKPAVRRR
jgi:Flp pilus assembly protein TadD